MQIWSAWRPDLNEQIDFSATEEIVDRLQDQIRNSQAVAAYSGGVDACATIWRHTSGLAGRESRKIIAGVLIQVFERRTHASRDQENRTDEQSTIALFEELVDEAHKNGVNGPLLDAVKVKVKKNLVRLTLKEKRYAQFAKPLLDRFPWLRRKFLS